MTEDELAVLDDVARPDRIAARHTRTECGNEAAQRRPPTRRLAAERGRVRHIA